MLDAVRLVPADVAQRLKADRPKGPHVFGGRKERKRRRKYKKEKGNIINSLLSLSLYVCVCVYRVVLVGWDALVGGTRGSSFRPPKNERPRESVFVRPSSVRK